MRRGLSVRLHGSDPGSGPRPTVAAAPKLTAKLTHDLATEFAYQFVAHRHGQLLRGRWPSDPQHPQRIVKRSAEAPLSRDGASAASCSSSALSLQLGLLAWGEPEGGGDLTDQGGELLDLLRVDRVAAVDLRHLRTGHGQVAGGVPDRRRVALDRGPRAVRHDVSFMRGRGHDRDGRVVDHPRRGHPQRLVGLLGGRRAVMHARLVEATNLPNMTLQVIPFSVGAHAAMDGSFTILGFPDPTDPFVVYIEYQTGALYLEKQQEVSRYRLMFNHLRPASLPVDALRALIARVADELA